MFDLSGRSVTVTSRRLACVDMQQRILQSRPNFSSERLQTADVSRNTVYRHLVDSPKLGEVAERDDGLRLVALHHAYSPGLPLLDRIHSSWGLTMRPPLVSGSFSLMWILHHLDRNLDQRARQR